MGEDLKAQIRAEAMARFAGRAAARDAKMAAVAEHGVLEAAGLASAVRRAAHMTVAEGRVFEGILGGNDSDHINFLEHGLRAARSVCRLLLGGAPVGTGFLVAPGLLLTNNHVLPDAALAGDFVAEFDYELDSDDQPRRTTRIPLDPAEMFHTSLPLDYTLVGVMPANRRSEPLPRFGWLPLDPRTDKILEGEPVVIIQHPQGREKQLCLFHSELVDRAGNYLYYTTDTEIGSSGSPAFNRNWQIVGLHHASSGTNRHNQGRMVHANEGVRVSVIMADLRAGRPDAADRVMARAAQTTGRPTAPLVASPPAATTPGAENELEASRTVIRTRATAHYAGRPGYDPAFLGTGPLAVPLPGLPTALVDDVATTADGGFVLPYMHFSVVMSASRRLPVFSAANIDGARWLELARGDRNPANPLAPGVSPEAAADRWFYDPRIDQALQLDPELYDRTRFDFGHVTRRQDPIWGTADEARIANDDTFHMTNCAPQHSNLNQRTWLALENAVLESATTGTKQRITVITGPVLDPRDPEILGVQVPTAYWKVVAWAERGRLRARAFLQWQTRLVAEIEASLESLQPLEAAEQWHVPLRDVARLTALDFGPLLAADRTRARQRLSADVVASLVPPSLAPSSPAPPDEGSPEPRVS